MKLVKTAKILLNIPVDQILPTVQAYTRAFNYVASIGFADHDKNSISLHKKTYQTVREYLPAQLAISSRMKAAEALASAFKKTKHKKYGSEPSSRMQSIRYDNNSYNVFYKKREVSLLTIDGRKRCALHIPEYFQETFESWNRRSAELCIQNNKVFLNIVFEKEVPNVAASGSHVGIDRGINNIAVVSNNKFYGGKEVKRVVKRYIDLRRRLQANGSRSAKRHLKLLSGKEKRFRADQNHCIAKEIINDLNPGDMIVLEDLKGIRNHRLRKPERTLLNGWSYYQFEQFLTYKALAKGIKIIFVKASYTSQMCSKCGHIDKKNRRGSNFCCLACGFRLDSDLNASRNICVKASLPYMGNVGADVNRPDVATEFLLATSHRSCTGGD